MRDFTWQEVRIMLTNLQFMVLTQPEVRFRPDSDMVVDRSGGYDMELLAEEGFTPGTRGEDWMSRDDG